MRAIVRPVLAASLLLAVAAGCQSRTPDATEADAEIATAMVAGEQLATEAFGSGSSGIWVRHDYDEICLHCPDCLVTNVSMRVRGVHDVTAFDDVRSAAERLGWGAGETSAHFDGLVRWMDVEVGLDDDPVVEIMVFLDASVLSVEFETGCYLPPE